MKNMNFEITENDVKYYLKQHKNDENFMYREAMFIKYLKEETIIKKETLEMLMEKYNFDNVSIDGIHYYKDNGTIVHQPLLTFSNYLFGINNLDISGICHIVIPCVHYCGCKEFFYPNYIKEVRHIASLLEVKSSSDEEEKALLDAIDNYSIAGYCGGILGTKIGKEKSRKMLNEYSYIYGDKPVKLIRRTIKERVK